MESITLQNGTEANFELVHASTSFEGHGHYGVQVELSYGDTGVKVFQTVTTDMEFIDSLRNDEMTSEEKHEAIYQHIDYKINEEVSEWIYFIQD